MIIQQTTAQQRIDCYLAIAGILGDGAKPSSKIKWRLIETYPGKWNQYARLHAEQNANETDRAIINGKRTTHWYVTAISTFNDYKESSDISDFYHVKNPWVWNPQAHDYVLQESLAR